MQRLSQDNTEKELQKPEPRKMTKELKFQFKYLVILVSESCKLINAETGNYNVISVILKIDIQEKTIIKKPLFSA